MTILSCASLWAFANISLEDEQRRAIVGGTLLSLSGFYEVRWMVRATMNSRKSLRYLGRRLTE